MNGMYHADFASSLGSGSGTVYLENGVLRGGDAVVAYYGTYTSNGSELTAQVKLIQHGKGFSVLGNAAEFSFQGTISGDRVKGTGVVPGGSVRANMSLQKIMVL